MAGESSWSAGAGRAEVAIAHGIQGRSKSFTHLKFRAHRCPAIAIYHSAPARKFQKESTRLPDAQRGPRYLGAPCS